MKELLIVMLSALATMPLAFTVPYKPAKYCTPTQGTATFCGDQSGSGNGYTCLHWHPDEEFCMEENAGLPPCCRATEKNNGGITACGCCSSVHGGKKFDGRLYHESVVEYDISGKSSSH